VIERNFLRMATASAVKHKRNLISIIDNRLTGASTIVCCELQMAFVLSAEAKNRTVPRAAENQVAPTRAKRVNPRQPYTELRIRHFYICHSAVNNSEFNYACRPAPPTLDHQSQKQSYRSEGEAHSAGATMCDLRD
jgi:hypothetical protein